MANTFPSDGPAGAGTANPTVGLLQIQVSQAQAAATRTGLALTVEGDAAPAMFYPRPAARGRGYDWYFTRSQQDASGLTLTAAGDVESGGALIVHGVTECTGGFTAATAFNVGCDGSFSGNLRVGQALTVTGVVTCRDDLAVQGALRLKNWQIAVPDYVFEPGYALPPLREVADFVGAHGHLPEVPAAAELERDGIDAAGMMLTLLKKVEELTLHLIRHEARLAAVEAVPGGAGSRP